MAHTCTCVVVVAARRVKQPSVRETGALDNHRLWLTLSIYVSRMADWDAAVGKAREDWAVMVSAGTLDLDERPLPMRVDIILGCLEKKGEERLQPKPRVSKELF